MGKSSITLVLIAKKSSNIANTNEGAIKMTKFIYGTYETYEQAAQAIDELKNRGINSSDMAIATNSQYDNLLDLGVDVLEVDSNEASDSWWQKIINMINPLNEDDDNEVNQEEQLQEYQELVADGSIVVLVEEALLNQARPINLDQVDTDDKDGHSPEEITSNSEWLPSEEGELPKRAYGRKVDTSRTAGMKGVYRKEDILSDTTVDPINDSTKDNLSDSANDLTNFKAHDGTDNAFNHSQKEADAFKQPSTGKTDFSKEALMHEKVKAERAERQSAELVNHQPNEFNHDNDSLKLEEYPGGEPTREMIEDESVIDPMNLQDDQREFKAYSQDKDAHQSPINNPIDDAPQSNETMYKQQHANPIDGPTDTSYREVVDPPIEDPMIDSAERPANDPYLGRMNQNMTEYQANQVEKGIQQSDSVHERYSDQLEKDTFPPEPDETDYRHFDS